MKKAIVVLPAIASALIVAIVIILLWMAGSASGERARFSSLAIAPKDADIFVAVNTDPTSPQWLAVDKSLQAINAKDPIRRAIDEALAEVNLDFGEDILPVAGDEAFFSVPDISRVGDDGGFVAGFLIRDANKAADVFQDLRERAEDEGEEFEEEEYEGVTIYYTQAGSSFNDSDAGAVALFEDVLAVGASPDDVKGVIDVVQGRSPSAEGNERLQEFREIQKDEFLVWGYADMDPVWELIQDYSQTITLEPESIWRLPLPGATPTADGSSGSIDIAPGIRARRASIPSPVPGLTPVTEYLEFMTDEQVSITLGLPLMEEQAIDARLGFFTYGDGGWSRVADVTLLQGGTVAEGDFTEIPENVVVFRDDSETPVTEPTVPSEFLDDLDQPDAPTSPFNIDSEALIEELRGTYDRVGFSVSAAADGPTLDFTVLYRPGFEPEYAIEPGAVFNSHLADAVPDDTMFFFAGYDPYEQIKPLGDYLDRLESYGGPSGEEFLKEFTDATGLDLEEDVLSMFTGEVAIAGNISDFEGDPPDVSIIAMADISDPAKAREAVDAIGAYLEEEAFIDIEDSDAVQRWEPLGDPGVEALGVTVTGSALIAGYPDTAVQDTIDGFEKSLADTADWRRTLKLLPMDTTSVGFVSLARILEELQGTEAEDQFNASNDGEVTLEDLRAIRSFAFATTSRENGFGMHFALFMEDH